MFSGQRPSFSRLDSYTKPGIRITTEGSPSKTQYISQPRILSPPAEQQLTCVDCGLARYNYLPDNIFSDKISSHIIFILASSMIGTLTGEGAAADVGVKNIPILAYNQSAFLLGQTH